MTKKIGFLVLVMACLAGAAYGQVTVSGGFALSTMEAKAKGGGSSMTMEGDVGLGGNIYFDYLLPISIPMSLGFEIGADGSSFTTEGQSNSKDNITAIPLLLRAAYHFDINPKMDLYLVGKVGYVIGIWEGDVKNLLDTMNADVDPIGGFGFGVDLGAAYYFTSNFGIFAERGFDGYMLSTKVKISGVSDLTIYAPFYRFLTVGISAKF
jgi:hypothetical protein